LRAPRRRDKSKVIATSACPTDRFPSCRRVPIEEGFMLFPARAQWRWLCLFVALGVGPAAAGRVAAVDTAIAAYVLPNVERFAETSAVLVDDIEVLCSSGSPDTLAAARDTFRNTVLDFARIEFLRIGPLETDNRRDRLLFWPDRRSIGLRQVQRALAETDESVLDPDRLAQKSVALQGFGALDYLLFGTGSETLAESADGFRCLFAESVAANIAAIANDVVADWRDPTGFAAIWAAPAPDNDLYRDDQEAIAALVGLVANALEAIRDQRLKPIAPAGTDTKPFKRALFWRSNLTRDMTAASLGGLHDLVTASELLDALPDDLRWIGGSVDFEFNNAQKALATLDGPVQAYVEDPEHGSRLRYVMIVTGSLQNLLGERAADALGLPVTFSPMDGD